MSTVCRSPRSRNRSSMPRRSRPAACALPPMTGSTAERSRSRSPAERATPGARSRWSCRSRRASAVMRPSTPIRWTRSLPRRWRRPCAAAASAWRTCAAACARWPPAVRSRTTCAPCSASRKFERSAYGRLSTHRHRRGPRRLYRRTARREAWPAYGCY